MKLNNMCKIHPFDFVQIKQDAEAYETLLFRERERRLQFVEIDKYPNQHKNVEDIIFYML